MKFLRPYGGWEQEQTTFDEIKDRVKLHGQIFAPNLATLAGAQFEEARVHAINSGLRSDSERLFVEDDDERLMRIRWDCNTSLEMDDEVVEEVRSLTGVNITVALCAARVLTSVAIYESTTWLTYFRTFGGSTGLHRDGEDEAKSAGLDWSPDPTFVRDIIHLDGKRVVFFSELKDDIPVTVELDSGDAYSLRAKSVYHDAHYGVDSKALYVHGYTGDEE